jgi:ubiquinone/menaquinone biosynthesis C-methylase UbiE
MRMEKKYNLDEIRNYWTQQALRYGDSVSASWSDYRVVDMEIKHIVRRLNDGDRVLDIGCGNGFSTVQFAYHRNIKIRGLDYIPELIEQAKIRLSNLSFPLCGQVEFDVDDITSLKEPQMSFDKIIVVRVIINLGDWDQQLKGLRECARILKPGGLLLLSEATVQGWQNINKLRNEWGLPGLSIPPFNLYLDQEMVVEALKKDFGVIEIINFSSTYYVGTRVLKPLLVKALEANIDIADPNMEWNRWFSQLPSWGDYGIQKLFVFQKR